MFLTLLTALGPSVISALTKTHGTKKAEALAGEMAMAQTGTTTALSALKALKNNPLYVAEISAKLGEVAAVQAKEETARLTLMLAQAKAELNSNWLLIKFARPMQMWLIFIVVFLTALAVLYTLAQDPARVPQAINVVYAIIALLGIPAGLSGLWSKYRTKEKIALGNPSAFDEIKQMGKGMFGRVAGAVGEVAIKKIKGLGNKTRRERG